MTSVQSHATKGVYGARFLTPLFIGPLLNPINTTMISVALVPIARDLDVPSSTVVWLVAGLYLTSAIAQPVLGRAGDILGARRVYLAGLVVVAVAGVLPWLADGFGPVVASRVLIGVGTSAAYPSVLSLIRDRSAAAGVETPAVVLSGISISTLTSATVGPVLGGALISLWSWRAIFLVNVPLALGALVMTLLWVPKEPAKAREADESRPSFRSLDPGGILLFGLTVAGLLVFLLQLDDPAWWLLPVAAALGGGLLWWELRHTRPFVDFRMLAGNGGLTRTYLRMFLLYLAAYSMTYGYSQWLQDDAGFSAAQAGFVQLPTTLLAGLTSLLVARNTRVWLPLVLSGALPLVGGLMLLPLGSGDPVAYLLVLAGLFGLGQGLASVSNQQVVYRQAPPSQLGTAAGLSRTFVYLGAIMSSGVLGATFGAGPTDGDMHVVGAMIVGCTGAATLLALLDRSLRRTG